ncbi:MAG: leucine-rich repeat domain-containing protein [archaeon]|nr:leucine-rich repeat domain-containing protein [archaeon]
MNFTKTILLICAMIFSLGIYAQNESDVHEIVMSKAGKLKKLVKKENNFKKIKISGPINWKDVAYLSEIENLEYLDLHDISFEYEEVSNSEVDNGVNGKYYNKGIFYLKDLPQTVKTLYAPSRGFKSINSQYIMNLYIPIGMRVHERCGFIYINGIIKEYQSYYNGKIETKKIDLEFDDRYNGNIDASCTQLNFPNKDYYDSADLNRYKADMVYIREQKWLRVNRWPSGWEITPKDIKRICSFEKRAFLDKDLPSEFSLNDRVWSLPFKCFASKSNVKKIGLNEGLREIGDDVFPESIKYLKVPSTVKKFGKSQIDTLEITSKTPPEWLKQERECKVYIIPDGTFHDFHSFNSKLNYIDKAAKKSYTIHLPKGNTILSYISQSELGSADSLTITGVLNEYDFEFIKKSKRLKYLDISKCYTTYSENAINKMNSQIKAMSFIFGMISNGLDAQYNDGNLNTLDYQSNKVIADEISKAIAAGQYEDKCCLIPINAFSGMESLEHVKLPILLNDISSGAFESCYNLRIVEVPPFLKSIGNSAFALCHKLQNFEFPSSLTSIKTQAFDNCVGLKKIDLSKCNNLNLSEGAFFQCYGIVEFIFPEGLTRLENQFYNNSKLKKVVFPSTLSNLSMRALKTTGCEFHFKSQEPPIKKFDGYYFGKNAIIYIPKGSITAYTAKFGDSLKYIEE